ncbi:hypothetical protein [Sphingomicrobium arenosum]|uniref:hypothetical protein n=1 Tax=Sphingomicrobium arenosum TaxID=2233861 RepID=UPI002240B48F|nr:hypothetical protein [Sphingomicrobium arenosum]
MTRPRARIVRPRWWASVLRAVTAAALLIVIAVILIASWSDGGVSLWGRMYATTLAAALLVAAIVIVNALPPSRVEIDEECIAIIGLLYDRHIHWSEVERIEQRPNYRLPGDHVLILVDGSRLPRRRWDRFWIAGYQIPPGNDLAADKLAATLRRHWNAWRRRAAHDA